jgi:hypothetical protein
MSSDFTRSPGGLTTRVGLVAQAEGERNRLTAQVGEEAQGEPGTFIGDEVS